MEGQGWHAQARPQYDPHENQMLRLIRSIARSVDPGAIHVYVIYVYVYKYIHVHNTPTSTNSYARYQQATWLLPGRAHPKPTACRFRSSMNCDGAWPRLKRSWHKHHILYGLLQINNKLPHGELWSNEYCCNLRMVCHSSYCRW